VNKSVTLLLNTFPSISETFILNQVTGLQRLGWQVYTISLNSPNLSQVHPDFQEYRCRNNLSIVGLPGNKLIRIMAGIRIFLKLLFTNPRIAFLAINRRRYTTAATSLKNLFIYDHLRRKQQFIPLLHAHFGPNGIVAAFLKDAGLVGKYVVSFHGSDINSYVRNHGAEAYRYMFTRADRISANTAFTARKIRENCGARLAIDIIPVGLNCADYPASEAEPAIDSPGYSILTIGRLVEKKGHRFMIAAMKMVLSHLERKGPQAIWHIAGDGPLKAELKAMVETQGLDDFVVFHGSVTSDGVKSLMQSAHLFVLPSVTAASGDMEGQGLVLQEAQSMGVPVVSTLHNGIPDGVLDGESGLLVPEKDSGALAEAIIKLLEDVDFRKRARKAGPVFVRKHYDSEILSKRWTELYGSLI
jgi:colanic acid/amylovoran biosynthesis glycosyltransferase